MITIRENLKRIRNHINFTQHGFGISFGSNKNAYQAYEDGRCFPSLEFIKKVIDVFEIEDVYSLLYGEVELGDNINPHKLIKSLK